MCGIAGIVQFNGATPEHHTVCRMLNLIKHRGPDSFGIYFDEHVAVGSARLSIIDLVSGDQPIHNEDESLWIVYNGEVFNYPELKKALQEDGHVFYTQTDTEILLHLYEKYGADFPKLLNGQFAFALWDKKRKRLMLGRDRMGIRPLFYCMIDNCLIFGSEIKELFADRRVEPSLNPLTLSDVFTCWAPLADATPFTNVKQLLPGHYALFSKNSYVMRPYWELNFGVNRNGHKSADEQVDRLRELMLDATRIRLRSDVPVGAYLSGGLDSTYVTSLVKKRFNNQLSTFSLAFADVRFDEEHYQKVASNSLGTNHNTIRCTYADIGRVFPDVIWHVESPLLRTAPAPLFLLSRLVHEHGFKVVLTGEGADEVFAGYDIFKEDRIRRFWAKNPTSRLRPLLLNTLYPDIFDDGGSRIGHFYKTFFAKGLLETDSSVYSHLLRWENTSSIRHFFSKGILDSLQQEEDFATRYSRRLPDSFMSWDPLSRAQYTECVLFLSNYLLSSQGDRMMMAHSVEGRFPFLDYRIVEFACSLPPRLRLNGLKDKFILRSAASSETPEGFAWRPKKPYRAPIAQSFLGPDCPDYVEELLSERTIRETGYFNDKMVARLVAKGRNQEGALLSERENMALVGIISVQLLHDQFVQGSRFHHVDAPVPDRIYGGRHAHQ